jgi:hypothetical protein
MDQIGKESIPVSEVCPNCAALVPHFPQIQAEDVIRVRQLIGSNRKLMALAELKALTQCSQRSAELWVEHDGQTAPNKLVEACPNPKPLPEPRTEPLNFQASSKVSVAFRTPWTGDIDHSNGQYAKCEVALNDLQMRVSGNGAPETTRIPNGPCRIIAKYHGFDTDRRSSVIEPRLFSESLTCCLDGVSREVLIEYTFGPPEASLSMRITPPDRLKDAIPGSKTQHRGRNPKTPFRERANRFARSLANFCPRRSVMFGIIAVVWFFLSFRVLYMRIGLYSIADVWLLVGVGVGFAWGFNYFSDRVECVEQISKLVVYASLFAIAGVCFELLFEALPRTDLRSHLSHRARWVSGRPYYEGGGGALLLLNLLNAEFLCLLMSARCISRTIAIRRDGTNLRRH